MPREKRSCVVFCVWVTHPAAGQEIGLTSQISLKQQFDTWWWFTFSIFLKQHYGLSLHFCKTLQTALNGFNFLCLSSFSSTLILLSDVVYLYLCICVFVFWACGSQVFPTALSVSVGGSPLDRTRKKSLRRPQLPIGCSADEQDQSLTHRSKNLKLKRIIWEFS